LLSATLRYWAMTFACARTGCGPPGGCGPMRGALFPAHALVMATIEPAIAADKAVIKLAKISSPPNRGGADSKPGKRAHH